MYSLLKRVEWGLRWFNEKWAERETKTIRFTFLLSSLKYECVACQSLRTLAKLVFCVETQALFRNQHQQMFIHFALNALAVVAMFREYIQRDRHLENNKPIHE